MKGALQGKKINIMAMGCRSNQSEADSLASMLKRTGAEIVKAPPYDAAVLITCTVTAIADKKSRQLLRRLRRQSPEALLVATGCWAQKADPNLAQRLGVDLLVGNRQKWQIPSLLNHALGEKRPLPLTIVRNDILHSEEWDHLFQFQPLLHSRAFVKIQVGCIDFCSYCVIPFVRGKPVSRPLNSVLEEVRSIADSGCTEVVLTGVHLGLYGQFGEVSLGELVRQAGAIPGVERIRFGSLEPFGINDELLSALAETPQFCPHLHLPLQSGDDTVLQRMRRGYSPLEYMASVERARHYLGSRIHISTDVLVGFPGEDERAFANTLSFMKEVAFGKVHVFPYSSREGTRAASFDDHLPRHVVQERVHKVMEMGEQLFREYCSQWVGEEISVFIEDAAETGSTGLTPFFVKAVVPQMVSPGRIIKTLTRSYDSEQLYG